MNRIVGTVCLLLSLVAACTSTNATTVPGSASWSVITRDEIDSTHAASIYDVIAQLRAGYLRDRGTVSVLTGAHDVAVVFLGDQEYGEIPTMRNLPASRVEMVRYFSGTDAVSRFGSQFHGGVIQLIPRYQ